MSNEKSFDMRLLIAFVLMSYAVFGSAAQVEPQQLNNKKSYEIAELVYLLMPEKGESRLQWSHLAGSNIVWLTDGIEQDGNTAYRTGLIRINFDGVASQVLKREPKELGWTLTYSSRTPKLGAELALISAYEPCLGTIYSNCSFDLEASLKRSKRLNYSVVCKRQELQRTVSLFQVEAQSRKTGAVMTIDDYGSGGSTTQLYMFIDKTPAEVETVFCE